MNFIKRYRNNNGSNYYNIFYFLIGIVFLLLAKIKNIIKGYATPKPFRLSEYDRCIEYDIQVVGNWIEHLGNYMGCNNSVQGSNLLINKSVLELGPGSDLGVGLYLISKGVSQYSAIDANNLVKSVPDDFYYKFIDYIKSIDNKIDTAFLYKQLDRRISNKNAKLKYYYSYDFDIAASLQSSKFDIVFSQAAFEHFIDIDNTVKQLYEVTNPGSVIVAEIDLKTHSRWIRDKDPNNIYRYPTWLYNIFYFRGIPNRYRPYQYKQVFEKYGWEDVKIFPQNLLDKEKFEQTKDSLFEKYNNEKSKMNYLSIILCATRK